MHRVFKRGFLLLFIVALSACGGGRKWIKNPVDDLIKEMANLQDFSVILHDMDVQGNFVKSYLHQYRIIRPGTGKDSIPEVETTDWLEVSEEYFFAHEKDMGMEIASKTDGEVSKTASPAGFSNYVGNSRYGQWRQDASGRSFWVFYGQYRFMSDMFGWGGPVYRTHYVDYRDNYYGRRSYYGGTTSTGNPRYGTNSDYMRRSRPNFYQRRASKGGFTRTSSRSSSRTSRSSSRYSSSSSRSRGGGFGK